ncbi:sodium-dependent bicarbonate transport family permease [Rhodoferax sp.]|uniref:sodium-dependent bicarbonate transport family permease n=1 Tax=Rhodoferax sp. TaxID=50421 RepID=UPI00374CF492
MRPRSLRRPCPPSGPLSAAARPKTSHHAARGDAAAISATYGSVSAVTFVTAVQYLEGQSTAYGGHLAAAMALMESPAIIMAVVFVNLLRRE